MTDDQNVGSLIHEPDDWESKLESLFKRAVPEFKPLDLDDLRSRKSRRDRVLLRGRWGLWSVDGRGRLAASVATAATILMTVFVAQWLVFRPAIVFGFAQVLAAVEKTQSLEYTETRTFPDLPKEPRVVRRVMVLGKHLQRSENIEPHRDSIDIVDAARGKVVSIAPKEKRFVQLMHEVAIDGKGNQTRTEIKPDLAVDFYRRLREIPDDAVERLPERTISGRQAIGFRRIRREGSDTWTRTVWVDPKTKLPVQIEITHRSRDANHAASDWLISDIVFDKPLDPSMFSTDPPPGYKVESSEILGLEP